MGGPVRDGLLGIESPDLDIAVEGAMPAVGNDLARELGGRFVFHRRFLTGTVTLPDGRHIDVCRTRTERYPRPAALPRVRPARIEQDLARRDFTINALAQEITEAGLGRLLDRHHGRQDLKRRRVRVLHARSFVDDPTRVFRAIRFATRLGFDIEEQTLDMMRLAIAARLPALLSPERVLYELRLFCREPRVLQMFEAVVRERVLEAAWNWQAPDRLLPGLQSLVQAEHAHDTAPTAGDEARFVFLLSALPVTDRFPIRREERAAAAAIRDFSKLRPRVARTARLSALHRWLRSVPDAALAILAIVEPPPLGPKLGCYFRARAGAVPAIGGAELRRLGLRPGPDFGRALEAVTLAKLDDRVRTRQDELDLVTRLFHRKRAG